MAADRKIGRKWDAANLADDSLPLQQWFGNMYAASNAMAKQVVATM